MRTGVKRGKLQSSFSKTPHSAARPSSWQELTAGATQGNYSSKFLRLSFASAADVGSRAGSRAILCRLMEDLKMNDERSSARIRGFDILGFPITAITRSRAITRFCIIDLNAREFILRGYFLPVGTAFHERTFPLCHSLNYREWSGYYTVSVYEVHHEHEYNAIRNAAALIDI